MVPPSGGWTVETLQQHIQTQLADLRGLLDERNETQTARSDRTDAQHGQLVAQIGQCLTREDYETAHAALVERLRVFELDITQRLGLNQGRDSGVQAARTDRRASLTVVILAASVIASVVIGASLVIVALVNH